MTLRYPVTIRRRQAGDWVDGLWVPGTLNAPETILATVQPARSDDYDQMQALPEGRRVEGMVRVYTDAALEIAAEDSTSSGDQLVWPDGLRDRNYVFIARSPWRSGIISHFRYLAVLIPEPPAS